MPEPDQFADERNEKKQPSRFDGISRREVLSSTAATGALLLGMDTAAAHGQGGQAVVYEGDFEEDQSFVIVEVEGCEKKNPDGSCWDVPLVFQCHGQGGPSKPGKDGGIPFPFWHFYYVDDDGNQVGDLKKLYTRDNEVKTAVTYHWPGNEKECPNGLIQTGFVAGSADK